MIDEIVFRTELTVCPECGSRLSVYKTERRKIKSLEIGEFIAVHRIMKCSKDGALFRSNKLAAIACPYCTYANDIMAKAAMDRFVYGKSCSEISLNMCGISESHVRNITDMALDIFSRIHEESYRKIRGRINSYVLQIDGTTDSEYDMLIAVRDSISGFTLYAEKYSSESYSNIMDILLKVRERFGTPSGSISDMRSGILEALKDAFPGMPVRICLMHFLRDPGKYLMEKLHAIPGLMINRKGIKSPLKSIMKSIPGYDIKTLYEIDNGYCTNHGKMEAMAIRRIIENIIMVNGSSGYGFPFSLKNLNFFTAAKEAGKRLSDLSGKVIAPESKKLINSVMALINRIINDNEIVETSNKLSDINMLFQKIRSAFRIPEKGKLSDEPADDLSIHSNCNAVIGEMEVYMHANIPEHVFKAAKYIIEKYHEREEMLFANNKDHTIPRTNNGMEQFFRKLRRNVRKRNGNTATGNILANNGVSLAIFQNIENKDYVKAVFGNNDIASVLAKYIKPYRNPGMTKKRIIKLVEKGTDMIITVRYDNKQ